MTTDRKSMESELQSLREKVAAFEAKEAQQGFNVNIQQEMNKIRQQGRKTTDKIEYKEHADHKNISLWHRKGVNYGKRVGPLHPDNAESTLLRFLEAGIPLTVAQPTQQEIDAYKDTQEYKDALAAFNHKQSFKRKSKDPQEMSKLLSAMEKVTGKLDSAILTPEAVNARTVNK